MFTCKPIPYIYIVMCMHASISHDHVHVNVFFRIRIWTKEKLLIMRSLRSSLGILILKLKLLARSSIATVSTSAMEVTAGYSSLGGACRTSTSTCSSIRDPFRNQQVRVHSIYICIVNRACICMRSMNQLFRQH